MKKVITGYSNNFSLKLECEKALEELLENLDSSNEDYAITIELHKNEKEQTGNN